MGRVRQSRECSLFTQSHLIDCFQWTLDRPHSVTTLQAHSSCVYQAAFSPHHPDLLSTCSADGTIKLFDLRAPTALIAPSSFTNPMSTPALTIPPSSAEVLTIDWNKYRPLVLASAGVDKKIRVWDCRMLKVGAAADGPMVGGICETELVGHEYAVRKVQWSPHRADLLSSASYDMTCRV